jgi:hypothetical protein
MKKILLFVLVVVVVLYLLDLSALVDHSLDSVAHTYNPGFEKLNACSKVETPCLFVPYVGMYIWDDYYHWIRKVSFWKKTNSPPTLEGSFISYCGVDLLGYCNFHI